MASFGEILPLCQILKLLAIYAGLLSTYLAKIWMHFDKFCFRANIRASGLVVIKLAFNYMMMMRVGTLLKIV